MNAETTGKKQQIGKPFKPGQSGNPKGRPKGSRNRLSEDFVKALAADFKEHGEDAIADTRKKDPGVYLRVITSILPKEIKKDVSHTHKHTHESVSSIDAWIAECIGAGEIQPPPTSRKN